MRTLFMGMVTIFWVFALSCSSEKKTEPATPAMTAPDLPQILVAPKGLVHSFWVTVKAGADSAGREFGATVIWRGPTLETDISTQIAILEDYINKGVAGIVLAACDAQSLVPVVRKAIDAQIPVVTIDSGIEGDLAVSHVATDNLAAARTAADVLANLIGQEGKVACIPFVPGAATSLQREAGFLEGIKNYPQIKVAAIQYSRSEVATGMAVTEDILTAHPDLKGIFAANEAGAIGAVQGLKSKNLAGKVKLVGFDGAQNEILALKEGVIDALMVQDPFKMGYLGVKMLLAAMNGKPIEKNIDTGVMVVTRANLDQPAIKKLLGL
ncbi:substrate-binding domain-containing protein [candidate division KSB1 bacterium]|nr:substrate-binding domain-containing protein [candidate division KSB1 bacterium]